MRKVDASFQEVLAQIVLRDLKDPRVDLVTVTGVKVSSDLQHATVFVTAHGGAVEYQRALAGLEAAKGRIRKLLGERMRSKFTPELVFVIDKSVDEGERIDTALRHEREIFGAAEDSDATESAEEAEEA